MVLHDAAGRYGRDEPGIERRRIVPPVPGSGFAAVERGGRV
jgi:hypothetical protein